MKIIAFGHRKRVGKDTCAKFLMSDLRLRLKGSSVKKVGFASKVKEIAHDLYRWAGLRDEDFYEQPENEYLREIILPAVGKTPREIWIGVGNGVRAAVGYDGTWSDYLYNCSNCDILIVKDLRFPGEADSILARGGWIYRVDDPRKPKVTDGADDPLEDYNRWTGIIDNSSDLSSLYNQIIQISGRHF